jgi:hypothetical protein
MKQPKEKGKGQNSLIAIHEPLVSLLIPTNPQPMEMTGDNTRPQRQHPDIRPDELVAQGVRETFLASFVGVVNSLARERGSLERRSRRDVEDGAVSGTGLHRSVQHRVGGVHVPGDVCGVHCLDGGDWEGVERGGSVEGETGLWVVLALEFLFWLWDIYWWAIARRAYVVDEDVDFAQLFHCGCHRGVDGFVVANVCCSVDDLTARRAGGLELLLQSAEFVLVID